MQLNVIYYLTASLLGGLHALEPGHGKTVVAAYLIGSKGTKIDAILLGLVVTFTHTFSVMLLAVLAKIASERMAFTEESLHGYLGFVAGGMILAVGLWMLIARIRGKEPFHSHSHGHSHHHEPFLMGDDDHLHHNDHGHDHEHASIHHDGHSHHHEPFSGHDHEHSHNGDHGQNHSFLKEDLEAHSHSNGHEHPNGHDHNEVQKVLGQAEKRLGYWQLSLLGISGGLVPCPAAIAILLAAAAAGRLGEGLTYILLFSLGLATVLIAIGLVFVGAGKLAGRFLDTKRFARKISIASAALITCIGLFTVLNSVRHVL